MPDEQRGDGDAGGGFRAGGQGALRPGGEEPCGVEAEEEEEGGRAVPEVLPGGAGGGVGHLEEGGRVGEGVVGCVVLGCYSVVL